MTERALIIGVTGQDGSYLAESLLGAGYEVTGMFRQSSSPNTSRISHIADQLNLVPGDMTDESSLVHLIRDEQPDEIYNLAAPSFIQTSWNQPVSTGNVVGLGVTRLLEAVRAVDPDIRLFQASSSEMYGYAAESPQDEETPFDPRTPYGVAKHYAHQMCHAYREAYGVHVSCGILFNHESPRRGIEFVTRKIANAVALISLEMQEDLHLGNLDAQRDWGHARDYVQAMRLMLQQPEADDFVIATGKAHSVRDFCEAAFGHVDLDWEKYVVVDPRFIRPADAPLLVGDASKAHTVLGWQPTVSFGELVAEMVDAELSELS